MPALSRSSPGDPQSPGGSGVSSMPAPSEEVRIPGQFQKDPKILRRNVLRAVAEVVGNSLRDSRSALLEELILAVYTRHSWPLCCSVTSYRLRRYLRTRGYVLPCLTQEPDRSAVSPETVQHRLLTAVRRGRSSIGRRSSGTFRTH